MKNLIFILFTLITFIITSCTKTPINGKIDGMWQLKTIKLNSQTEDVQNDGIYWSFQLKLCQITSISNLFDGKTNIANARFIVREDSLIIPEIYLNFRNSDSLITNPTTSIFIKAGIDGNHEKFRIITLNKNSMILENGPKKLLFRKQG